MEKLNRDKRPNRALLLLGLALAIIGCVLIKDAISGHYSKGGRYIAASPALKPWGIAGVAIGAVFLVGGLCFRNYYKVDYVNRNLCYRLGFLWLKSERVTLPYKFISATTVQGRKRQSKYSSWWTYRVVAISSEGKVKAMSDWRREECSECNEEAEQIAARLNVKHHRAPGGTKLRASSQGGVGYAEFVEPGIALPIVIGIIIVALVIGGIFALRYFVR